MSIGKDTGKLEEMGKAKSCMKDGYVRDWEHLEHIWLYSLSQLKLGHGDDVDFPVMVTASLNTPKRDLERMANIMFETFHVESFYVSSTLPLALFAAGR